MAISSTNVKIGNSATAGSVAYNLWGSVYAPTNDKTWTKALGTANYTGSNLAIGNLRTLARSFSKSVTSLSWSTGVYGNKTITITANCAWRASISGSANFSLNAGTSGTVTLTGSAGTGTYGGNGSIIVTRSAVAGSYTGTVTITYSNGAGGSSTTTVSLSAS